MSFKFVLKPPKLTRVVNFFKSRFLGTRQLLVEVERVHLGSVTNFQHNETPTPRHEVTLYLVCQNVTTNNVIITNCYPKSFYQLVTCVRQRKLRGCISLWALSTGGSDFLLDFIWDLYKGVLSYGTTLSIASINSALFCVPCQMFTSKGVFFPVLLMHLPFSSTVNRLYAGTWKNLYPYLYLSIYIFILYKRGYITCAGDFYMIGFMATGKMVFHVFVCVLSCICQK